MGELELRVHQAGFDLDMTGEGLGLRANERIHGAAYGARLLDASGCGTCKQGSCDEYIGADGAHGYLIVMGRPHSTQY